MKQPQNLTSFTLISASLQNSLFCDIKIAITPLIMRLGKKRKVILKMILPLNIPLNILGPPSNMENLYLDYMGFEINNNVNTVIWLKLNKLSLKTITLDS